MQVHAFVNTTARNVLQASDPLVIDRDPFMMLRVCSCDDVLSFTA